METSGPLDQSLSASSAMQGTTSATSAMGGLYAYRLGFERPLYDPFPPFGQRSLPAEAVRKLSERVRIAMQLR